MNKKFLWMIFFLQVVLISELALSEPFGAQVSPGESSRMSSTGEPENNSAIAGNTTEITLFGNATTQFWQGYFGNVTGAITLSTSTGNRMYNWSGASPNGQIYASNQSSINWSSISCYNMSKVSELEASFGINASSSDGVNETFNLNNHQAFETAGTDFSGGECNNTQLFNNSGEGVFDVVLLEDGDENLVFASIILSDATGFDGKTHDFQMIVLEDGRTDSETTPYYFWVEII